MVIKQNQHIYGNNCPSPVIREEMKDIHSDNSQD